MLSVGIVWVVGQCLLSQPLIFDELIETAEALDQLQKLPSHDLDIELSVSTPLDGPSMCVLVHGTWGRQSRFCDPESPFWQAVVKHVGTPFEFRIFQWSGENSHRARLAAGEDLQRFLGGCSGLLLD
jgi:hypothetical protein